MAQPNYPQPLYPNLSSLSMSSSEVNEREVNERGFVREVYPNLSDPVVWKSLVVNTGASHGTLQDIKLPEYSGGYTFVAGGSRRTLFWRVSHDTLELVEESTDVDVVDGHVRLQFPDTPILEGISVHERPSALVLLLATVSSVHRLQLALPGRPAAQQPAQQAPSLLLQLSAQQLRQPDAMHVLHSQANAPLPHTAATWLLPSGEAVYLLAGPSGGGQLVRYLAAGPGPLAAAHQLQTGSVVGRLLGLFADAGQQRIDAALVVPAAEPGLAAVCRDGRLRLWALQPRAPLLELDLLALTAERRPPPAGARRHGLRRLPTAGPPLLAAHLCLAGQQAFVLLRLVAVRGVWQSEHVATVCAPDHDLIDFSLTEDALWALWSTPEADTQLRYYPLPAGGEPGWREVALVPPPPAVHVTAATHLSQAYLQHIFCPGRFQPSTIQRAVSIYSRSECTETEGLRAAVVATVEAEVQRSAPDYQLPAAEFNQLSLSAWDGFYSACLQYHQVGTKPVGLSVDPGSGQVCVVRQAFVSYLRPADLLEQLWLADDTEPERLADDGALSAELKSDVARLVQCCRLLEAHISADLAAAIRQDLAHLQTPDVIARSVVAAISEEPTPEFAEFRDELAERIAAIASVTAALSALVALLQVDDRELLPTEDGVGGCFSSRLGCGLLAAAVEQALRVRFSLSCDLVLLETLMLTMTDRCQLTANEQMAIISKFVPETVIQVQAYFGLLWLVETPAEPVTADRQESALRQMAALSVSEPPPAAGPAAPSSRLTLLQLFVAGAGGRAARGACVPAAPWRRLFPELVWAVTWLVWPVSRQSALPELLLTACQHAALREYVRLHQSWCDWNSASRSLLLGLALLGLGQPDKACDVLVAAADAVGKDEPLLVRLLRLEPAADETHGRLLVRYYLRVIQLLELHQLPDWVLELARAGIDVAADDDPNVATLWSIAFKYHLRLGHVTEAYAAMNSNPELSRRRDCLRQLVVTLHERADIATLVRLPYVDMLHEVVAILEDRARAADPLTSQFYDILYAFHVLRSDYRKAGTVMYECGRRLAATPAGRMRQADCYRACVNALQLVSPEYAWIVRPEADGEVDDDEGGDGDGRRVAVLTLEEIRREADLVAARLRLHECEAAEGGAPAAAGPPAELVARLVAARLYTDAVRVARAHHLSVEPVARELAAALAAGGRDGAAWQWLGRNELPPAAAAVGSAAEQTAALLRHLLAAEPSGDTRLLRAAAGRLLQLGRPLPAWLAADYERRNAAELGRLLLRAGRLEAAGQLLLRLLEALLGAGQERFGLRETLHATSGPVWLPYTLLDQVLAELRPRRDSPVYGALHEALSEKLRSYQETLARVSADMATLR